MTGQPPLSPRERREIRKIRTYLRPPVIRPGDGARAGAMLPGAASRHSDAGNAGGDLRHRVRAGARWSLVNTVVIRLGTFATGIVLARGVFGPKEFGLYATGLVVLSVLLSANEMGVSLAMIRWEGDVRRFAPTVLTLSLASSTLLYAVLFFVAPAVARMLGSPGATSMLRVLCFSVVIDGAACIPAGVLTREFAQRDRMLIDLTNFTVSTGITVGLAYAGAGAMSFAWGAVFGNTAAFIGCAIAAPGVLKPGWDPFYARALLSFGVPLASASMFVLAMLNVDSAVVGSVLGTVALGLYQTAFNMSSWPVRTVSEAARRVSFAGFSRIADSPDTLSEGFGRGLNVLMTAAVPACAMLAVLPHEAISVIYGARWTSAAGALRFLSILGLLRIAYELSYDCLVAAGRRRALNAVQGWWLLVLIPVLIVGAHVRGITGVGAGHIIVAGGLVLPAFLLALRSAGIHTKTVVRACWRPFAGGVMFGAVAYALHAGLGEGALSFLLAGFVATLVYIPIAVPWATLKRGLSRVFGWLRLLELRNKVTLGWSAWPLRRFENREVRRLRQTLPDRPSATVTTVVTSHLGHESLARAVDSALRQSVRDQNIIVVDDGTGLPPLPDDPRLCPVTLSHTCSVPGVVRNIGLRLAESKYVAFLDDDMLWEPDHLATTLEALDRPSGPDGVYTSLRRVHPNGVEAELISVPFDRRQAADKAFLDTNAFVARRTPRLLFSRIRRESTTLPGEDWELIFRFSRRHRVEHIPHPTVKYLINPDNHWTAWEQAS